ncbi:riboflavin synthase [Canibacter zhoujuaniae]|uniref:riboflavin synthase n=1 Tax=Canibacter zhoujuaniae TaxID=2708343 RepID=UPI0014236B41|nr:riboflavin synthase [Canibacter zhoujuaniae]
MFTGLIEATGEIVAIEAAGDGVRLTVRGAEVLTDVQHGDSIAVSGVCLTAVEFNKEQFTADVMEQTLRLSTLGRAQIGRRVNLERAAKVGARLGGHIVQGHIDGIAEVLKVRPGDKWRVLRFSLAAEHAPLVVDKGSITVDGVSLTVSKVSDAATAADQQWFEVSLIPETLSATTLGERKVGDVVNIETDILARHVARLTAFGSRVTGGARLHDAAQTTEIQDGAE